MTSENSAELPNEDSADPPRRSLHFPNENLLASPSPFVDANGRNPFADSEPHEAIDVDTGESNAYVSNYAGAAATPVEFEIRLNHRGGTLLLVAFLTVIMSGLSWLIGPAMWVVGVLGLWVFFCSLSDLNRMQLGRMNDEGRRQTRVALILTSGCLIGLVGSIVFSIVTL